MSIETMKLALEVLEELNKLSIGTNAVSLPAEIDTAMDALSKSIEEAEKQETKREWVGLTEEETRGCIEATIEITDPLLLDAVNAVIIDVERLLREKNT